MTTPILIHSDQVNSINRITTEIEKDFSEQWSIVTYDDEGGIWIESFEPDQGSARLTADRQHANAIRQYKDEE